MDPKTIRFERVQGRRPILESGEMSEFVEEGRLIREADDRDGTNAFLEAAFEDAVADEPDYKW